jgi:hypothetical protein
MIFFNTRSAVIVIADYFTQRFAAKADDVSALAMSTLLTSRSSGM